MISCAIAFMIFLDCLLIPFVFFLPTAVGFCSVLFFFFFNHAQTYDAPFPLQLAKRKQVCFLLPTNTIVSSSCVLGNFCIFK